MFLWWGREAGCGYRELLAEHGDTAEGRVPVANKLHSHLREYYPAFASACGGITQPEARVILAAAPTRPLRP